MYPRDAVTFYYENSANGTFTILATSTRTILNSSLVSTVGKGTLIELLCGTDTIFDNHNSDLITIPTNYVCSNKPIRVIISGHDANGEDVILTYVSRDRTLIADPTQDVASSTLTNVFQTNNPTSSIITNFPTAFNILNFPTLQDVKCIEGCSGSSTVNISSSSLTMLYTGLNFNEWLLVAGIFLAISALHIWKFLFPGLKEV